MVSSRDIGFSRPTAVYGLISSLDGDSLEMGLITAVKEYLKILPPM